MKKFFGFLLLSFFICFFAVLQVDAAEIYVYPVATEHPTYQVGDTIKGQFTIHNVRNERQSDVIYSISVVQGTNSYSGQYINEVKSESILYLESNSKRNISFNYTLPDSVAGDAQIVVRAFLTDGTIVAHGNAPIKIFGKTNSQNIFVSKENIQVNLENFSTQSGPTVTKDDKIFLTFEIPELDTKSNIKVKTQLFNRVIEGVPNIILDNMDIVSNSGKPTVVTIPLPTNLEPGVYAGVTYLDSREYTFSPIEFRYIVGGDIATIRNVNSNKLSLSKREKFEVMVKYTGNPIPFNNPDIERGTSTKYFIDISVTDQDNVFVASSTQEINFTKDTIIFSLRANKDAESLKIGATLRSLENKILSSFETVLPSEEEITEVYGKNFLDKYKNIFLSILLVSILIFLSLFYKNKKQKEKSVKFLIISSILFLFLIFTYIYAEVQTGYQVESGNNTINLQGIELTALYSPLPPSVRSYNPGEYFDIVANVQFGACLNAPNWISFFTPYSSPSYSSLTNPSNWTSSNLNYSSAWWIKQPPSNLFNQPDLQYYYMDGALYHWMQGNYNSQWGSYGVWSDINYDITHKVIDLKKIKHPLIEEYDPRSWTGADTALEDQIVFGNGESLGYFVSSDEFDFNLKALLSTNSLNTFSTVSGTNYRSCNLRTKVYTSVISHSPLQLSCYEGALMYDLFPPVNLSIFTTSTTQPVHKVLISKHRGYEVNEDRVPFVSEFSSNPSNYPSATTIRNYYKESIKMLLLTQKFMQDYQITGWQDANSFNFGGQLSGPFTSDRSLYDGGNYALTYNEAQIDIIAVGNYNSSEFNTALRPILDFLFYYNKNFFYYAQAYHYLDISGHQSFKLPTLLHSRRAYQYYYPPIGYSYFIPPLPGMHKIYFYLFMFNHNYGGGLINHELLISQPICIRGAGVCPDEQDPLACPNLTIEGGPVYTEDELGIIYRDGVATDLTKDGSGNCVNSPGQCDASHNISEVEYIISEGVCSQINYICSQNIETSAPEWQQISTNIDCSSVPPPTVSCSANPQVISNNEPTIFSAISSGGVLETGSNYTWIWSEDIDFSNIIGECTNNTCEKTYNIFSLPAPQTIYVKVQDSRNIPSGVATSSCIVNVGGCPGSPDTCQANQKFNPFCNENTGFWEYTPTGQLCNTAGTDLNAPKITTFKFNPGIVSGPNESCPVNIVAEKVNSCRVFKNGSTLESNLTSSLQSAIELINFSLDFNGSFPVGQYQIGCTGTSTEGYSVDTLSSIEKCIVNPNFKEN